VDGANNHLAVIDGATRGVTLVPTGNTAYAVAVNPYTNKIYIANFGDGTVTVVDGIKLTTTTVNVGVEPLSVAIARVTKSMLRTA
jgi:YVTN family beta-propeller protein